jgi:hypothetical protein
MCHTPDAKHNPHEHILVHPKSAPKIFERMCCDIREVVGVKQQCASLPMSVLVQRLPKPRTSTPRDIEYVMSNTEVVGKHHRPLFPLDGGIGLLLHEHMHH